MPCCVRPCPGRRGLDDAGEVEPALTVARQGFTYDQPCYCNSITRTTPDFTTCACDMMGTSLPSALRMFSRVLPQALKEISGVLNASTSIRAFTGEVSSRNMCRPGQNVTTSIDT